MSISCIAGPSLPQDTAAARDPKAVTDTSAAPFAQVLAGAMSSAPEQKAPPDQSPAGTSDLDGPEQTEDADESSPRGRARKSSPSDSLTNGDTPGVATPTPTTADAGGVSRSVALLNPDLQARLTRVVDRVRDETGHEVQVTETYRTQARQDALFAQGRDTTGPVVTWTRHSLHTAGRAVDVTLDGGDAPFSAYAALQRIAGEEGLHTLGVRDPGHLELPAASNGLPSSISGATNGAGVEQLNSLASVTSLQVDTASRLTSVARTAVVASLPSMAPVARVATIAQPAALAAVASPNVINAIGSNTGASNKSFSRDSGAHDGRGDDRAGQAILFDTAGPRASGHSFASAAESVTVATALSSSERTMRVLDALDATPPRTVSQLTMSVDNTTGGPDRVQVSMRGTALAAAIDASDPRAAQQLMARSDELVRALQRDGVQVDQLRVRAVTQSTTSTQPTGGVTTTQANSDSRFNGRDQSAASWTRNGNGQRSRDDRRQQQRDSREGRQQ